MKNALIISGVFHVSLLITAAMDIPWFDDVKDVEMVVIPIEMVDISDITRTVAIAKKPEPQKEKPKPPQKRPERRAEMPPPPPMPSTMPLPTQSTKQTAKPKPPVKERRHRRLPSVQGQNHLPSIRKRRWQHC
ncbi:MAG: hypothetical protein JKY84_02110 [Emcibacteraceae bacterium]|nr:hypothetical protein [Emcibacteraceae bacterium]